MKEKPISSLWLLVAVLLRVPAPAMAQSAATTPATPGFRYDFDIKLDMQTLIGLIQKMGANVPTAALANLPQADGSSLLTALNEQLGLKVESSRGPVDVLVIDSVEAPTAD